MKRTRIIVAAALIGSVVLVALDHCQPYAYMRVCNLSRDALSRLGRKTPPNPDLVFLAIDSNSVSLEEDADLGELYGFTSTDSEEARALKLMSKGWPWSREVHGLVLERLMRAGAKVVIFDLTFPTATEEDASFRVALERYKDRVVIGSNLFPQRHRGFPRFTRRHRKRWFRKPCRWMTGWLLLISGRTSMTWCAAPNFE